MKNRKLIKVTSLSVLISLFAIVSCSDEFLEVAPTGSLGETELASFPGLEGSLTSAYSMLLGRSGFYSDASNWFWGSVLGGDANKGTNEGDQSQVNEIQKFSASPNNPSVLQKYEALYEGIARANATLLLVSKATSVSADNLTRITAEARFLRAHYYFELKRMFNNTPYVDETWDGSPVANDVDLYSFIEADFQFAFDNLPETQGDVGRANKWAAGAYLAKTYLYQANYSQAKTMFDMVITSGVTSGGEAYGLLPNYANAFRSTFDNSAESVFASQAAAGTGSILNANPAMVLNFPHGSTGPARPGGCCGFFQPSFELANSFRTDASGLPLLDGSYNDVANALVTDFGLQSASPFTVDAGNVDTRLDHSIGRREIPYLDWGPHPGFDWVREQSYGGPYSPKKFIYYEAGIGIENDVSSWTPGYTAVNYNIIRFADVLLMAAEAEVEAGSLAKALEYVNRVRTRAMNSTIASSPATYSVGLYVAFADKTMATNAVRMERKLELSGEGHRFYDLVRWGVASNVISDYLTYEKGFLAGAYAGAAFSSNKNEYLPIPQNEIDLLGESVLVQNPGY